MSLVSDMTAVRTALAQIPSDVSHSVGSPPALDEIFTPARHSLALDPDLPIVVGARGTGKSFWASVFADDHLRQAIAPEYPRLHLGRVVARPGFVGQPLPGAVTRATLDEIGGNDERKTARLWLMVALRAAESAASISTFATIEEGNSLYPSSEAVELRLHSVDQHLMSQQRKLVVVFDALDRLSNDWTLMQLRTSTLLETLLDLRAFRAIRFKLFMRPEQLGSVPTAFTDLSKLKAGSFDLRWTPLDLFGLAFTYILNHPASSAPFRDIMLSNGFSEYNRNLGTAASLPLPLLRSPVAQERLFTALAGPYMGINARRGRTYTWLPNHLSDTKGRLTPRSFLTALGGAARHERPPLPEHALTVEGIKHGVSEASILRVDQLKDEYGWIDLALQPLAGQEVPCPDEAIYGRWEEARTLPLIEREASNSGFLGPFKGDYHDFDAPVYLLNALMDIGVIEIRPDGRVNIPDLFRIAALMLRRGGLRPMPRG